LTCHSRASTSGKNRLLQIAKTAGVRVQGS
jgi:hypothetical protein